MEYKHRYEKRVVCCVKKMTIIFNNNVIDIVNTVFFLKLWWFISWAFMLSWFMWLVFWFFFLYFLVILWHGVCSTNNNFTINHPIILHKECLIMVCSLIISVMICWGHLSYKVVFSRHFLVYNVVFNLYYYKLCV